MTAFKISFQKIKFLVTIVSLLLITQNCSVYKIKTEGNKKPNKLKVYRVWVKRLDNQKIISGNLYSADSTGINISAYKSFNDSNLTSIDYSYINYIRFKRKGAQGKLAIIGGATGLAIGLIAGGTGEEGFFGREAEMAILGVIGGLTGAGIGALLGSHTFIISIKGGKVTYLDKLEMIQSFSVVKNNNILNYE